MNVTISYKAIEARKFISNLPTTQIATKSALTSVTKTENGLSVGFVFISNYEPNIGFIRIEGEVYVPVSPEESEKAIRQWVSSENKGLPENIAESIHNTIISNCMVETVIISREINLPPPFPVPHIQLGKEEAQSKEVNNTVRYIQ